MWELGLSPRQHSFNRLTAVFRAGGPPSGGASSLTLAEKPPVFYRNQLCKLYSEVIVWELGR